MPKSTSSIRAAYKTAAKNRDINRSKSRIMKDSSSYNEEAYTYTVNEECDFKLKTQCNNRFYDKFAVLIHRFKSLVKTGQLVNPCVLDDFAYDFINVYIPYSHYWDDNGLENNGALVNNHNMVKFIHELLMKKSIWYVEEQAADYTASYNDW